MMSRTKLTLLGGLFLLLVFIVQGIFFIRANSQTIDEAMHLAAGYSYLTKRDFRIEPQNPPLIKELLALPALVAYRLPFRPDPQDWRNADGYLIGRDLLYQSKPTADQILTLSRFPNLFLGGMLVTLTGWWAYRLWGHTASMVAMALASFEPNLVAHSCLVTTDIGVTLFIFLTVYLFWEYVNQPTWRFLVATGISTGLALVAKFSAVLVIPMIALIVTASLLTSSEPNIPLPKEWNQNKPRHKLLQAAAVPSLIFFVALLTIPPVYLFQGFQPWLSGLYQFLTLSQEGLPAFFFGEYSWHNWWSYFPITFLIKTPVGSLVLITISLGFYRAGSRLRYRQALFLVLPVILIFLTMTQAKTNIGLRHILPIYPFLFVLASRVATLRFRPSLALLLIGIPLVWTVISSFRIAPHQLAYFNESVGGPEQGYRYLSDSNIDWGQDLKGVKAYMDKENLPMIYLSYFGTAPPSYYDIRYQNVAGKGNLEWSPPSDKVPATAPRKLLAISVYNLQDVSRPNDPLFRWLWVRQPVAKIGYSIFIYDLTNDPEGLMKLEEIYVKAGIQGMSLRSWPVRVDSSGQPFTA